MVRVYIEYRDGQFYMQKAPEGQIAGTRIISDLVWTAWEAYSAQTEVWNILLNSLDQDDED